MAFKFITFCALIAVASAGVIDVQPAHHAQVYHSAPATYHHAAPTYHHAAPAYHHAAPIAVKKIIQAEHYAPAEYEFAYSVHDDHTGDIKSQKETRKGDHVVGQYSLIDADGHKRTVDYTADEHHGFNAVVHREPLGHHHQPIVKHIAAVPTVAKVVAPAVYHHAAPAYHHAPAPVVYKHAAPAYTHSHTIASAPVLHKTIATHHNSQNHVSFSGAGHNYHY